MDKKKLKLKKASLDDSRSLEKVPSEGKNMRLAKIPESDLTKVSKLSSSSTPSQEGLEEKFKARKDKKMRLKRMKSGY